MVFSVLPIAGANNLKGAMEALTKQISGEYDKLKLDAASEETEAGIRFIEAEGTARKGAIDLEVKLLAFRPDNAHYFGITLAMDAPSVQANADKIDKVFESIRSFRELASWVLFPKAKPAFALKIPPELWKEETEQGLTMRVRKESKEFFRIAEIPASAGITNLNQAKEWLEKQAKEQLKKTGAPEEMTELIGVTSCFYFPIAVGECQVISFMDGSRQYFELTVFTLDQKRFFLTHYEQEAADFAKEHESGGPYWWEKALASVKLPQK
jgi:hypothetical protein